MTDTLPTDFAPAEREKEHVIRSTADLFHESPFSRVLDALPVALMVLNAQRQVVYCNAVFHELTKKTTPESIVGMRPGEALGCIHSGVSDGGCGTSKFCRHCGAAVAIVKSLETGSGETEECRILRSDDLGEEALDLQVFTSPFNFEGIELLLVTAVDISHEKRRRNLETIFFHDVLNLATGLKYASQMACKAKSLQENRLRCRKMDSTIMQIVEEIRAQKDLSRAEKGVLRVNAVPTSTHEILERVLEMYSHHKLCRNKELSLSESSVDIGLETDETILGRVLGNMVKNALEATPQEGNVTLGAEEQGKNIAFWVHNGGVIAEDVGRQIFKRSFSTKEEGRGLGTYSIKLLGETYLNGYASFTTNQKDGTVFRILLPKEIGK